MKATVGKAAGAEAAEAKAAEAKAADAKVAKAKVAEANAVEEGGEKWQRGLGLIKALMQAGLDDKGVLDAPLANAKTGKQRKSLNLVGSDSQGRLSPLEAKTCTLGQFSGRVIVRFRLLENCKLKNAIANNNFPTAAAVLVSDKGIYQRATEGCTCH